MAVIPPKRPAHAVWSKNWNCRKDGELSIPVVASPGGAGYDFWANQSRIGWRGGRMDWARVLAFVTGMVDQELLARIEYLAAETKVGKPPAAKREADYRHPEAEPPCGPMWARRRNSGRRSRPSPIATTVR